MLNFAPLSDEELLNLIPDGEYDFLVKDAQKHISQAGNVSIKLTLEIFDHNSSQRLLNCFLSPNYMFLLKHFCDTTGLEGAYESGSLSPEMCLKQNGRCKIGREEPKPGTNFPPKNVIKDFVKRSNVVKTTDHAPDDFINDAIPF